MLTIQSAHTPSFTDETSQHITLFVKFEEFSEELPFGATPNDCMPYGIELYHRAFKGEFGQVALYVPPTKPE